VQHIFISYSRADVAWVKGLVVRLEERGLTTWLDERDVPVTLSWIEEVRDAIVEARLFVNCDSERSRASANCAIERGLAAEAAKEQCTVHAGGDLRAAAASVITIFKGLDPATPVRTELTVLARDWDRAGRPKSRLVSARMRRRLRRSLRASSPLRPSERAFLAASRARSRRRAGVSIFLVALAVVALTTIEVVKFAKDRIVSANSAQAAAYTETRAALAEVAEQPFQGMAEASRRGGNESADGANVISGALRYPVPDDAFKVPGSASLFATSHVGAIVSVTATVGGTWGRTADAVNVRNATALARAARRSSANPSGGLSFHLRGDSGALEVLRDGRLWRVMTFTGRPSSLTLSPDGRELAVAVGALVEIAELQSASIRTVLRGAPGDVRALAWSADGRRLWALCHSMVVSWAVRDGTVLLDEPAENFEAVFPGGTPGSAWVVAHDGTLREFDTHTHTGSTLARLRVPDEIDSAGAAADGTVAALSGAHGEWIVPLDGARPRHLDLPGCELGRPMFENATTFRLPCLFGEVLSVSVAEGRVTGRLAVPGGGAFALASLPASGTLSRASRPAGRCWSATATGTCWHTHAQGRSASCGTASAGQASPGSRCPRAKTRSRPWGPVPACRGASAAVFAPARRGASGSMPSMNRVPTRSSPRQRRSATAAKCSPTGSATAASCCTRHRTSCRPRRSRRLTERSATCTSTMKTT
jgi:hypothetical protein